MVSPYDPAQFFANLMKSGQEQMQRLMSGAAVPSMLTPGMPDPTAQMATAAKQFADIQKQYLASFANMAPATGVDFSAQMAAVTKQVTDLQQQYIAGLQKLAVMPAPDVPAQFVQTTKQFTELQQQYLASLAKVTGGPAASPEAQNQLAVVTHQFADLQQQYLATMQSMTGAWSSAMSAAGAATAPVEDKRFGSDAWSKDPRFDAVRRMYLAYADFIEKAIEAAPSMSGRRASSGSRAASSSTR